MANIKSPTLLLGAGLTGLSCAYHLKSDYLLVEKENEPGGIVRTRIRHDGFLCDGTGHWLHLRNEYMKSLAQKLLPGQLVEHERKAVIHMRNCFTPYPFQANTYGLPAEIIRDCLLGLLKARHPEDFGLKQPADAPANFRQWIERYFGDGISKHFMIPYNEKLLGVNLEKLRPEYAERFIPRPSLEDVIKGALGFSRESLGYNARFVYPREGGISALPRSLAANLRIPPSYNLTVTKIYLESHTASLSDGRVIHYDRLLNTSPLPRFLSLISDLTPEIRSLAGQLHASTVHYFDIGVRGAGDIASAYHWIYFPEPEFIFYRSGSYSAVHSDAAPAGCRSYYVEMSGGAADWLDRPEELKKRVLADLRKARVLSADDEILFMELSEIPFAYVIFDQNYESCRKNIFDFLTRHDVISAGRWGGWNYGGMEDALLEGKAAADQINAQAS
jgi:protoporphyrinogen oxidase